MSGTQYATKHVGSKLFVLASVLGLFVTTAQPALAQTETILYSFTGSPDGEYPLAGVTFDAQGNLYGTTGSGGAYGGGMAFEVTVGGEETALHSFRSYRPPSVVLRGSRLTDGSGPSGRVVFDPDANLYGTTGAGGTSTNCGDVPGCGTVFKIASDGTETVLYSFTGTPDGSDAVGGMVLDTQGNLYGTTWGGGAYRSGTVFKLTPGGTETVLYSFAGGADGLAPSGDLVLDAQGNLYGTTFYGGGNGCWESYGCGTVFKLTPNGAETVLYRFIGYPGGSQPNGGLVFDSQGNLYGTTNLNWYGGESGYGTVFKLTPGGTETVLYTFTGGADGANPLAGLIFDTEGNLYGTTRSGGTSTSCDGSGCGTVFKLTPDGTETALYNFTGGADGSGPIGSLIFDKQGDLYGATEMGGSSGCNGPGCGTVFKLTP